ncbi:MAG: hypothetical protein V4733_02940 [Verrucomicrobiota bacterium]
MHFIGIEISPPGTRAVVLDVEAAVILAEAWAPHDWIDGLMRLWRALGFRLPEVRLLGPGARCEAELQASEVKQNRMSRQQCLVGTLHLSGLP